MVVVVLTISFPLVATSPTFSLSCISIHHIDGLAQDCSNSIALAMQLLQSCTKPSMFCSVNQSLFILDGKSFATETQVDRINAITHKYNDNCVPPNWLSDPGNEITAVEI